MKRTLRLSLILILLFFTAGYAQITITQDDVASWLNIGNTLNAHSDTTTQMIDIGTPGAQMSWDFSAINADVNYDVQVINPSRTEFDTSYTAANITSYYQDEIGGIPYEHWLYYNLNQQNLLRYGDIKRQPQVPDITQTVYSPARIDYAFPLVYNNSWNQTLDGRIVLWHDGLPTTIDSATFMITVTIDAYGNLTMPDGSTENALRMKYDVSKEIQRDYSRQITYEWLTASGRRFMVVTNDTTSTGGQIAAEHISWEIPANLTEVSNDPITPQNFDLSQNYPNPFNPSTKINYQLPAESKVVIKIYNSIGKEVQTLINRNQSAGAHTILFNASALPSGIYFARMRAGNFNRVIKMTLLK